MITKIEFVLTCIFLMYSVDCICTGAQFWNPLNNDCVNGKYFLILVCPWHSPALYYGDSSSQQCVTTCPTTPSLYANDLTQLCVAVCPWDPADANNQTYYDNYYRKCTLNCSSNPSTYAAFGTTNRTCLTYCEANSYALDTTRKCVDTCPSGSYYFIN
eukprot:GHVR01102759.1.p1 GENE.GHVR01102759.1~~GHVR01102759.1.p1  ORF type:complete len:158 (+),score=3.53 GHVR01102759.1:357-830(+)